MTTRSSSHDHAREAIEEAGARTELIGLEDQARGRRETRLDAREEFGAPDAVSGPAAVQARRGSLSDPQPWCVDAASRRGRGRVGGMGATPLEVVRGLYRFNGP
jgi:hypothetical protein